MANYLFYFAIFWWLTIIVPIVICSYTFRWLNVGGYRIAAIIVPVMELTGFIVLYNHLQLL